MNIDRLDLPQPPDVTSWLHADAYLRHPERFERRYQPQVPFCYREPGLWLPLSCAITFVGAASFTNVANVSSVSFAGTGPLAAGNLFVIFSRWVTATATASISDVAGNTWISLGSGTNGPTNHILQGWYCYNCLGSAVENVTITYSAPSIAVGIVGIQFSGLATAVPPLDQGSAGSPVRTDSTTAVTTITSPAFTTTSANQVLIAGVTPDTLGETYTPGAGYTIPAGMVGDFITVEYQIVSSIQTGVTASMGLSSSITASIQVATFQQAVSTTTVKQLAALGCG